MSSATPLASRPLRIGTRGSPMALRQTAIIRDRLIAAHPELAGAGAVEIVTIRTTGDRVQNRLLAEIGGKGLFAKEIEEALLAGMIDLAVHSLKDLETWLPDGLVIACVPPRDDPRDTLLSVSGANLASLPCGAKVGTASLRRQAQLLRHRPDLSTVPIRGNVNTRLRKMEAGEVDALVLALCGLVRLDLSGHATEILPREVMLPALHDPICAACVDAERAMLAALDGSCRTPIAGFAEVDGDRLTIEGLLLNEDGSKEIRGRFEGGIDDGVQLGAELGKDLRSRAGPDFGLG